MDQVTPLYIDTHVVGNALEALRQGRALQAHHPLLGFLCLRKSPDSTLWADGPACEVQVYLNLCRIIRRRLARHRLAAGVTTSRDETTMRALCTDFQHSNSELEAWSLLYFRYVRSDLALSLAQISQLVKQTSRTLNRRLQLGLQRLMHELVRQEQRVRAQRHLLSLRIQLGSPLPPRLLGRQHLLEQALQLITVHNRHLFLYGGPGVGKSTFALALAHKLIEQTGIEHIVWIDLPLKDVTELLQEISMRLGCSSSVENIVRTLQNHPTLIVLDHNSVLVDEIGRLVAIKRLFSAAWVILCADRLPGQISKFSYLQIPELDVDAAFAFMDCMHQQLPYRQLQIEHFEQFYRDFGGNPKALQVALMTGSHYQPKAVSVMLYKSLWTLLSPSARQLWLELAHLDLPFEKPRADGPCQADSETELVRASILTGNLGCSTLVAAAKTFGINTQLTEMIPS